MPMRFYIIRHGETNWNKTRRIQGQTDIPLNENGRELARRVGEALFSIPFARILSSPLSRALETAGLAAGGRPIPVVIDPRLCEISFGEGEGCVYTGGVDKERAKELLLDAEKYGYPQADSKFHLFFDSPEKYVPPPGGERFEELLSRTKSFLDGLAASEREETLLISTHGAASRALLANIGNIPLKNFWQGRVPPNCSVSIVSLNGGVWKLCRRDVLFYL